MYLTDVALEHKLTNTKSARDLPPHINKNAQKKSRALK